ncbi:MAG: helix-turn-helix domain-containing protein [Acidobacteria bacterium]|nr:helix-turn-helix domain-containing protein [Acidobacteriota bacterium]
MSEEEARELSRRATRFSLSYWHVVRAKMILFAARGMNNDEIAARLDTRREVVSRWRKRFYQLRLAGLDEPYRRGQARKEEDQEPLAKRGANHGPHTG